MRAVVKAYINCYTANSGYTNVSRRFRAAIEKGELTYEDYSQDVLMLQPTPPPWACPSCLCV